MLDDLTKEIKAQLYERVKSPLFGAFALSWVAWNFRPLMALFSEMPFKEKVAYFDAFYSPLWWQLGAGFFFPLGAAVLFILVYPWPARWMYWYWANQQKKLKEAQQKIEDETPLTQEEARALRQASLIQAAQFEERLREIQQTNSEFVERLKIASDESAGLRRENKELRIHAEKLEAQLQPQGDVIVRHKLGIASNPVGDVGDLFKTLNATTQAHLHDVFSGADAGGERVLLGLVVAGGAATISQLARMLDMNEIETKHGADVLQRKSIANLSNNTLELNESGRAFVVRTGLSSLGSKKQGMTPTPPIDAPTQLPSDTDTESPG